MKDYQTWVKKNEDLAQKYAPPGWKFRGSYAYVLGFGRYDVATMWECENYSDFDAWRKHDDENWIRLFEEVVDFFLPGTGENVLLREIGDTRIIEPRKENP